ncbi:MAG: helix-turn-helix domain-containing protein [Paracoccus sp. (in: a-proteobacteria)]|nr:helix-turn-helix domain-containing protein [Paracoccus sp. (in: a-proteobacteria)]
MKTARKIQAAAMRLASRDGMAGLTAEAIAREAGISTRTFFNYYPFKEAALMGPPPDYPADAAEQFVEGRGRLIDDLHRLMERHLGRFIEERAQLAAVLRLAETDAKLAAMYQNTQNLRRAEMATLLFRRVARADPVLVAILSSAITAATEQALVDWAEGRQEDIVATGLVYLEKIGPAVGMLNRKPD